MGVSKMIAEASLKLEVLSASFLAEARFFFNACGPRWIWPRLVSLTITSRLLKPDSNQSQACDLLQAAANTALRMPKLQIMEIWYGKREVAALFRYQSKPALISWRGTWNFILQPRVVGAWEKVALQQHGCRPGVVKEELEKSLIQSHGDAIYYLGHLGPVLRPISLRQIRREDRRHNM